MTSQRLLELARQHCTHRQYQTYELHARGLSIYTIALHLDLSPSTIRDHLRAADRNIHRALKETP